MAQCEMCGTETSSPKTVKVEGAELEVCERCASHGTEVKTEETSATSTKYSTSSSSGSGSSSTSSGSSSTGSTGGGGGGGGRSRRSDMFDDVEELAPDYGERIRRARESRDMSQSELANELNEKASLIRKLERDETLPSDRMQSKLERFLDIELSGEAAADDSEWEADSSTGEYTLGDMVERKD